MTQKQIKKSCDKYIHVNMWYCKAVGKVREREGDKDRHDLVQNYWCLTISMQMCNRQLSTIQKNYHRIKVHNCI